MTKEGKLLRRIVDIIDNDETCEWKITIIGDILCEWEGVIVTEDGDFRLVEEEK